MTQMRPAKPVPNIVLGFPLLVAMLALGFGLPLLLQSWDFVSNSARVGAEVITVRESTSCSEQTLAPNSSGNPTSRMSTRTVCSTTYFPTVKYTTLGGREFENETMDFLNSGSFAAGEKVTVRYRQDDPYLVQIDRWRTIWGPPTGLLALGVLFAAFAYGLHRINVRAKRSGRMVPGFPPEPIPKWVIAASMAVPLTMSAVTALIASDTIEFYNNSRMVQGKVVEPMVHSTDRPVLAFLDQFGQEVSGPTETNPFDNLNVPDRRIGIRHRLDDPKIFRAAVTPMSIWWPTVVMAIFAGIFTLAISSALLFLARGR